LNRFAAIVSGRYSKFIVLGAWVLIVSAAAPLASRFEDAQRNEPSSFLPGNAESLAVLEAAEEFPAGKVAPAVIVYRRAAGLTDRDLRRIDADRALIADRPPTGLRATGQPVLSDDGLAALVVAPIVADGDDTVLLDAVDRGRSVVHESRSTGLEVEVSGPAGFSADASAAFEGINSTLLLAAGGIVFVLLVLIYRSPIFWLLPLLAVALAELTVRAFGYLIADAGVIVNGQTGGILLVLVFGAGTDYALLLTARYREELRRIEDRHEAMRVALRRATPALLASAGTVIAGLLCLSLADVNGTAGLGPIGAMGVAIAVLTMLTALPALLLVGGRRAFWPFVPRYGDPDRSGNGFWRALGDRVASRPRRTWIATSLALGVLAIGLVTLDDDLTSSNGFRGTVEAVEGQELIAASFPAGANAPVIVLVERQEDLEPVRAAVESSPAIASIGEPEEGGPGTRFEAVLRADPFSEAGYAEIEPLRSLVREAAEGPVLLGGPTAEERDLRAAAKRDTVLLIPVVLVVVLAVLVILLRALVAPLVLVGTVVLSFAAALGVSVLLFEVAFDFPGEDPSLLLFAFIFLVALGVDYNIFLMARVREEAQHRPTADAMKVGLAVTGGVITSAGLVLAGTFGVLAVLPIVALTQIGFVVALGVLLDTAVVRSVLVPAIVIDLKERTWAPAWLGRRRPGKGRIS
jgi:RND superfamily putative drug exporter